MRGVRGAFAFAALLVVAAGCGPPQPDVLLVTADTLRADRLDLYRGGGGATPELARLAAEGASFDAAISPMQITRPSHFSLFTSLYPRDHGVVSNHLALPDSALTLAEVLRDAGYRTGAFVAVRLMGAGSGAEQGFDVLRAPRDDYTRSVGEVVPEAIAWLRKARGEPSFAWIHVFDPHLPYAPPPDLLPEGASEPHAGLESVDWSDLIRLASGNGGDLPRSVLARALALYEGEVARVDRGLGRLFAALREDGRLDGTVVAFTADHGECFENGIWFEHSGCLFEGAARVPLIVRFPGRVPAGSRRAEVVELVDVAPTLLDLAGIPAPALFLGRRLFDPTDPAREAAFLQHPLYTETAARNRTRKQRRLASVAGEPVRPLIVDQEQVGLRTRRWKLLVTGAEIELYDLDAVPGERRNVSGERPDVVAELHPRLERWQAEHPLHVLDPRRINDELLATLRALGYIE